MATDENPDAAHETTAATGSDDDAVDTPNERSGPADSPDLGTDRSDQHSEPEQLALLDETIARLIAEGAELSPKLNRYVRGRVTLHFPHRDVTLPLDGKTALAVLAHYVDPERTELSDPLDPDSSSAARGWLAFDLATPMAVSWYPALPTTTTRTTFDPPV